VAGALSVERAVMLAEEALAALIASEEARLPQR
jgi:hypothetical protein